MEMVNSGTPFNFECLESLSNAIEEEQLNLSEKTRRQLALAWIKKYHTNLFCQLPEKVQAKALYISPCRVMNKIWL